MEQDSKKKTKGKIDIGLIIVGVGIQFLFVIFMVVKPLSTQNVINGAFNGAINVFGSMMMVFTFITVGLAFFLGIGKYGNIKLGNEEPEYSMFSYIAMMTLASLASAALYWSFTEWASYYMAPGIGLEPLSLAAAEMSLGYAFFHWGISGQALYVLTGVTMAYAYYVRKVPILQVSAVCNSMMGSKVKSGHKQIIGKVIDFIVIIGVVGGLGSTLGLAVPLAAGGLKQVFGIEATFGIRVAILLFIALVFTFTSFMGTKKGMKNLSNLSAGLCILMLIYVFFMGPTTFIMKNIVNSFGWMMEMFPRMSLFTDPIAKTGFPEGWTIYFEAFYLNYVAMMGIFIAKVSRGRTIRQVTWSSLFGISIGGWALFGVNGSFAMNTQLNGTVDVTDLVNAGAGDTAIYQILKLLPGGAYILPFVVLLMIVGFVASSLDTASFSLAQTTTTVMEKDGEVNRWLRVFWCFILTLIPLSIMFANADFSIIKNLSILTAIPFMFIVIFMDISLFRWLKEDRQKQIVSEEIDKVA